uniref:Protein phosphatase 1 regulatory subunit 15A n=1 Tax=Equus asinus asinus TaxID=83772 RepID=A0A8C4LA28_EQUAS
MAPGQAPHHPSPWRDAHPFFLLSPLMGLLSWAWSHLRGPGSPEPWLAEAVTSAHRAQAGLEGVTKASLATHHAPWGRRPQEEGGDPGAAEEDREASWGACPDWKANTSPLEAWGLSDDEGEEEATEVPREQGSEFIDGRPALRSPSLLIRTLQEDPPREEESAEGGVAEDKEVVTFSFPPFHWECCPGVEEEKEGDSINKESPRTSTCPLSPGSKPRAWVDCSREEENQATEEERRESREATKTSVSPSTAGSQPRPWERCSGAESEEEDDEKAERGEADPEPLSSVLAQRPLLRTRQHQPSKITEEEDEEQDEFSDSGAAEEEGEAEGPSSIPSTSAFLRAWVYRPGEDTEEEEEEDELSDSGAAEEEGEAKGPSSIPSTSAFLRAWVYRPGEDTEEEEEEEEDELSDSGAAEEEGEAKGPSSIPSTSAFLRAWVYRPGEDTEEEEEEEEDELSDSGAAEEEGEAEGPSSIPPTSAFLRAWVYRPGEDTEEEEENEDEDDSEAAVSGPSPSLQAQSALLRPGEETEGGEAAEEWGEAEPSPFRVAIYLPGEKAPPPWTPPRLPLRLQRRLKSTETPTRDLEPETPLKARKVCFSEKVTIHFLVVWAGPAQAARRGPWEQLARDRSRFAHRIARAQEELGPCLTPAARARAWARLRNPPASLATIPAATHAFQTSSIQAMPLSHAVASPSPPYVSISPCLDLSGRRG